MIAPTGREDEEERRRRLARARNQDDIAARPAHHKSTNPMSGAPCYQEPPVQFGTAVSRKPAITPAQIAEHHFVRVPVAVEVLDRQPPCKCRDQSGTANTRPKPRRAEKGQSPC